MRKILVTGAAGFIGRRLCETLTRRGYEVVGWDSFADGLYNSGVKKISASKLREETGVGIIFQDLLDIELMIPEGVDVVLHAAAMPGLAYSWDNVRHYVESNQLATHNLLKASLDSGIEKFVHVSTSSVYGKLAQGDESSELHPVSPYGISKLAAEHTVAAMSEALGPLNYSVVRLFSVYGPWQRPDMAFYKFVNSAINDETITIYGDGQQTRSNTFVDDAAEGVIRAMKHGSPGETYNIGGGEDIKLLDAVKIIGEEIGVEPKLSFKDAVNGDQRITSANIEKASRELGYQPETRFRDGIKKQIEWQKSQRVLENES